MGGLHNETFWFRDENQFRLLEEKLYAELLSNNATVNIWSAASSAGQEPYSISLSVDSFLNSIQEDVFFRITATDISSKMIARAKRGVFTDFELERGLPSPLKDEHFTSVKEGWLISARHRARVSYSTLNLMDDFKRLGCFDIIFCRNVLMYFSTATKLDILNRLQAALKPGGYLFLSNTERLPSDAQGFEVLQDMGTKYYRKI
ncbi:MAG: hypothetical protein COB62_05200 [Piscirickettsiaceae bacterium]|nr:MAG: hypothetical protein COB62_05200 [Piscirickettsiaceae bacterium]